jgi:molybdopterin molybdotransferase
MTFEQFVRPALRKLTGHRSYHRPTLRATLAETLTKKAGRLHFVRVELERRGGEVIAHSTGSQSSGVLRSMARAQGFLIFPADATELAAGDTVTVQVLAAEFFAETEPGF